MGIEKLKNFSGSMVALVTPFTEDDQIDYEKLRELVRFHLENGTDGIVALGTTAETPTLTDDEKVKVAQLVIDEVGGRIPVIVGAGSNNTMHSLELSKKYEAMGADGLLLISPYYNKANARGMLEHFKTVADRVNIPIILYNVPSRTGCFIPISDVAELSKHPNVIGIKEASGDIGYLMQTAKYVGDDFKLFSGNDNMIIPVLSVGGCGVISVFANICPKECHDIVELYLNGKEQEALALQLKYLDFIDSLFIEANPIPIKEAMGLRRYRLPLCEMSEGAKKVMRDKMAEVGLC